MLKTSIGSPLTMTLRAKYQQVKALNLQGSYVEHFLKGFLEEIRGENDLGYHTHASGR